MEVAQKNNPHGWGIVFAQDGRLHYCKKMASFQTFLKVWDVVPDGVPVAIHFRWKTHGDISKDNIHPFQILSVEDGDPEDICLMHNGVLSFTDSLKRKVKSQYSDNMVEDSNDKRSDTALYVEELIRPIIKENPKLIHSPQFREIIRRDIGYNNKFLILDGAGKASFVNFSAGTYEDGVWFSNSYSFKEDHRGQRGGTSNAYSSPTGGAGASNNNTPGPGNVVVLTPNNNSSSASGNNHWNSSVGLYEDPDILPEEIKKALGPNRKLRIRKDLGQAGANYGYGWVVDTQLDTQNFDIKIAGLQRAWYARTEKIAAEMAKADEDIKNISEQTNKTPVILELPESAIINNGPDEANNDTRDFRTMNSSEILNWVVEYPTQAAKWLQRNGFYGSEKAIEEFIQTKYSVAAEYIHDFSHGRYSKEVLNLKIPKEFVPSEDDIQQSMFEAMVHYG